MKEDHGKPVGGQLGGEGGEVIYPHDLQKNKEGGKRGNRERHVSYSNLLKSRGTSTGVVEKQNGTSPGGIQEKYGVLHRGGWSILF